jgi:hypothetical protein
MPGEISPAAAAAAKGGSGAGDGGGDVPEDANDRTDTDLLATVYCTSVSEGFTIRF